MKTEKVTVVPAVPGDVPAVHAIAASLALDETSPDSRGGFLISGYGRDFFLEQAQSGHLSVAKVKDEIAGYFVTWDWATVALPKRRDVLAGLVTPAPDLAALTETHFIDTVGVSPRHRGRGVGDALYADLFRRFPGKGFLAFVVEAPHRNEASIRFHEKHGFERVACFRADRYGRYTDFRSGVWYRKPRPKSP